MQVLKEFFCEPIYILANRIVTRCRSERERRLLNESFKKHFNKVKEDEVKASEYERIISKNEELIEAVKAVEKESIEVREMYSDAEEELIQFEKRFEELVEENRNLNYLIALVCELHSKEDWSSLDGLIRTLSQSYLPRN